MKEFPERHAVSRARFFLQKATECPADRRRDFEAYLEACIIFARAAIHRAKSQFEAQANWRPWWDGLLSNPSVDFFRTERDWILKEAPPKIGQVIRLGDPPADYATDLYYFEGPEVPAVVTLQRHLNELERIIADAEGRFAS